MKIGINVSSPTYFSRSWVFNDIMLMGRNWIFPGDPERRVPLLDSGYPDFTQIDEPVVTSAYVGVGDHYPDGSYIFSHTGKGDISFTDSVKVLEAFDGGRNLMLLDVDSTKGPLGITVSSSDANDPLDNFTFVNASDYFGSKFNSEYLNMLDEFNGIRFTSWQGTNNITKVPDVNKRTLPGDAFQRGSGTGRALLPGKDGVAIENMVRLCNETNTDAWFNMYHLFDEAYVRNFAEIVRDKLKPGLKVRLEWSNEFWNGQFVVFNWLESEAEIRGISKEEVAKEEHEKNWDVWFDVFAGQEDRLIRVIGTHVNNPSYTSTLLETGLIGDELAGAPYFAPHRSVLQGYDGTTTLDQLFADLDVGFEQVMENVNATINIAKEYDMEAVCYEGGQGFISQQSWRDTEVAAQKDPRMGAFYDKMLPRLSDAGITHFYHFSDVDSYGTSSGSWGASEFQDEPGVKLLALLRYIDATDTGTPFENWTARKAKQQSKRFTRRNR
jgi:hypothetical protein